MDHETNRHGQAFNWPASHDFGRLERALDNMAREVWAILDLILGPVVQCLADGLAAIRLFDRVAEICKPRAPFYAPAYPSWGGPKRLEFASTDCSAYCRKVARQVAHRHGFVRFERVRRCGDFYLWTFTKDARK